MERELENQRKDPDDVFFFARDRKQEIREQIKELQRGLKRQPSNPDPPRNISKERLRILGAANFSSAFLMFFQNGFGLVPSNFSFC